MPEFSLLIFSIFLLFFFLNLLPQVGLEQNLSQNFFFLFLGLSNPVLAKNITEKRFFNFFDFFFYFFQNFLAWVEYERNSGLKRFPLFLSLSHPVLAKNNVGKSFYNFLNFFVIFFGIFLPRSSMNRIRD